MNKPRNYLNYIFSVWMLAFCLWFGLQSVHPFYLGITEIECKQKHNQIHVSIKLFLDDVMAEINRGATEKFNPELRNSKLNNKLLEDFLRQGFSIKTAHDVKKIPQSQPIPLSFIGWELEEGGIWMYLEGNKSVQACLEVNNNLLCKSLDGQIHILKVTHNNKTQSDRFTCSKTRHQICF